MSCSFAEACANCRKACTNCRKLFRACAKSRVAAAINAAFDEALLCRISAELVGDPRRREEAGNDVDLQPSVVAST